MRRYMQQRNGKVIQKDRRVFRGVRKEKKIATEKGDTLVEESENKGKERSADR